VSGHSQEETEELPVLRFPDSIRGALVNKAGIVTGASHGIGAATAMAMVLAGAKVTLAARNKQELMKVEEKIKAAYGGDVLPMQTDVTDSESIDRLVKKTLDEFGRLDFAFNNAGDGHLPAPLAEVSLPDFSRAIDVNVLGTFLSMKHEILAMIATGGGSIVNMSSTAGLQGVSGIAGYVAGKHAIIGLTRTGALDYAGKNVRINAVAPGPIFTERFLRIPNRDQIGLGVPLGRIGNREEVATAVVWLCSDLASFVTGTVLSVDGGRMAGTSFSRRQS
jgi:NAD(P)-dependent dehydrogenase (short-subunit alcohol dehydrogenase family)